MSLFSKFIRFTYAALGEKIIAKKCTKKKLFDKNIKLLKFLRLIFFYGEFVGIFSWHTKIYELMY